jgi:hypothetical protein
LSRYADFPVPNRTTPKWITSASMERI